MPAHPAELAAKIVGCVANRAHERRRGGFGRCLRCRTGGCRSGAAFRMPAQEVRIAGDDNEQHLQLEEQAGQKLTHKEHFGTLSH